MTFKPRPFFNPCAYNVRIATDKNFTGMLFSKSAPGPPVHHPHMGANLAGGAAEHVQGAVVGVIYFGLVNLELNFLKHFAVWKRRGLKTEIKLRPRIIRWMKVNEWWISPITCILEKPCQRLYTIFLSWHLHFNEIFCEIFSLENLSSSFLSWI